MWFQKEINLKPRSRGFHIITNEVLEQIPEIKRINIGNMHIFIKHTSASLTLNENASGDVRTDMEKFFNKNVPENEPYYEHTMEGPDDMPAHIKATIIGPSLMLPVKSGQLNLGTWQGVFLCEHRNNGGSRKLVITLNGEENE